jgi:hypothetical protein
MEIEGTAEQLYFIEETQIQYRCMCENGVKLTMANNLVKRVLGGPGFIKLFSSHIVF